MIPTALGPMKTATPTPKIGTCFLSHFEVYPAETADLPLLLQCDDIHGFASHQNNGPTLDLKLFYPIASSTPGHDSAFYPSVAVFAIHGENCNSGPTFECNVSAKTGQDPAFSPSVVEFAAHGENDNPGPITNYTNASMEIFEESCASVSPALKPIYLPAKSNGFEIDGLQKSKLKNQKSYFLVLFICLVLVKAISKIQSINSKDDFEASADLKEMEPIQIKKDCSLLKKPALLPLSNKTENHSFNRLAPVNISSSALGQKEDEITLIIKLIEKEYKKKVKDINRSWIPLGKKFSKLDRVKKDYLKKLEYVNNPKKN